MFNCDNDGAHSGRLLLIFPAVRNVACERQKNPIDGHFARRRELDERRQFRVRAERGSTEPMGADSDRSRARSQRPLAGEGKICRNVRDKARSSPWTNDQIAVNPLSPKRCVPEIRLDSSLARKSAACATSSGSPMRPCWAASAASYVSTPRRLSSSRRGSRRSVMAGGCQQRALCATSPAD